MMAILTGEASPGTIFGTLVMSSFKPSLRVIIFVLRSSSFCALVLALAGPYLQQILFWCGGGTVHAIQLGITGPMLCWKIHGSRHIQSQIIIYQSLAINPAQISAFWITDDI